jgi:hypothetical protein
MPKINVYLPDELAQAVREAQVPVSAICQSALERAVRDMESVRAADEPPSDDRPGVGLFGRFTPRARGALTLATLRRDGSPRISGTELEFSDGDLFVGMMPGSRKALDLQRDPRVAIHGPTADPPDDPSTWAGEAKVAGRAIELPRTDADAPHRFRIDIDQVVFTHLNEAGDRLVIEAWHAGRGLEVADRA